MTPVLEDATNRRERHHPKRSPAEPNGRICDYNLMGGKASTKPPAARFGCKYAFREFSRCCLRLALVPVRAFKVAKLHERLSVSPSAFQGRSGHSCQLRASQPPWKPLYRSLSGTET